MLFLFVFACGVGFLNGQCSDRLSDSTCINIENCETLRPLVTKHKKSSEELSYLRKQTCGFNGTLPKICCPKSLDCVTPDGVKGQCIDIHNCSNFIDLLRRNPTSHDIIFIQRSRCYGPAGYSVCCRPPPPLEPIKPIHQIDAVSDQCPATSLPPGPETGCCGQIEGFNKITGGTAANIDQFPWLVLIEYRRENSERIVTNCGGALISGKYVLTAAHCVDTGKLIYTKRELWYQALDYGPSNIGGTAANIDQFPWLVLIEYRRENSERIVTNCGGALISGKYVLTAAHCVDTGKLYTITSVRLGDYDTTNTGPDCVVVDGGGQDCTYGAVSVPVEQIIKHPNYQGVPDYWNDIALLRLAPMITYNYFIRPICLPSTNISESAAGHRLLAAGWGAVDGTGNDSPVKQVVDLPVVDLLTCHRSFSKFTHQPRLWGGQMCAGGELGKDACTGDSGGPLMKQNEDRYEMVGVVSYGTKPCGRLPGVYTNVHAYLDWIQSHIYK